MACQTIKNILMDFAENAELSWETIARCCLDYMTNDDVFDMAVCNELIDDIEANQV